MRSKTYRYGNTSGRTYLKAVGNGWECGFIYGGKTVFVGNFIHSGEATRWFTMMNREILTFGRRFTLGHRLPTAWTTRFLSNRLYSTYYTFLDRIFTQYHRTFNRAVVRDMNQFRRSRRNRTTTDRKTYLRAA